MKKITLILLCLMVFVGVMQAEAKKKEPIATAQSTLEVSDFNALNVSSMIQVVLDENRPSNTIAIHTENIEQERVNARVQGGVLMLSLHPKKRDRERWKVTVYVSPARLEKITCSGMTTVTSTSATPLKMRAATIRLSGMSKLAVDLQCETANMTIEGMSTYKGEVTCDKKIEIDLSGMSECTIGGTAGQSTLDVSGMSKLHARNFSATGSTSCDVAGMSKATITSNGDLKYSASGMSTLHIIGSPNLLSGSGSKDSTVTVRK